MATRITLTPQVLRDLERVLDDLVGHGAANAGERAADIVAALDVLVRNPMIGRPAEPPLRELIIGCGTRGCVALYRHKTIDDTVVVVGIRAQREAGYPA